MVLARLLGLVLVLGLAGRGSLTRRYLGVKAAGKRPAVLTTWGVTARAAANGVCR